MTRVNVGIHPHELPNKLLLAEHREITRIPNQIRAGKLSLSGIPEEFTLGKGHVKFFCDKLEFLEKRYMGLYEECIVRGFSVTDKRSAFTRDIPAHLFKDYVARPVDRQIIIDRIRERGFDLRQPL